VLEPAAGKPATVIDTGNQLDMLGIKANIVLEANKY